MSSYLTPSSINTMIRLDGTDSMFSNFYVVITRFKWLIITMTREIFSQTLIQIIVTNNIINCGPLPLKSKRATHMNGLPVRLLDLSTYLNFKSEMHINPATMLYMPIHLVGCMVIDQLLYRSYIYHDNICVTILSNS